MKLSYYIHMNKKAIKTLEYNKIISMLAAKATSEPGRTMCNELTPITDINAITASLKETSDAASRILRAGSISFSGLSDIRFSLKSLDIGSTIGIRELINISTLLKITHKAARYNHGKTDDDAITDSITGYFNSLFCLDEIYKEIDRCIISEDEISDDASSELKHIRRQITLSGERIKSELSKMLSGNDRTYLQEAVITTRNGRYCVPVKAEYKSQIPGMVHDQSKAGSTFFIEPVSVVRLNNEIRELKLKETEEIARLLATLSAMAGEHTSELLSNYETLTILDFIFAKASFSLSYKGSEPLMNTEGIINIKKGRHPLIDPHKVVPVDIVVGNDYHQLIITGPNTGGKTVTLKTIGLFSLMAQSGLHIPAFDNSMLTVFDEIYADIGDEQSIEQSLSTFSSHMTNIINILDKADKNSLVLFDELCAGTDPTEGAALAISILTSLRKLEVTTVATTHYSELKIYALSTDGVENACCEFDVSTLAPTYKLLIGIPGKSNAFAISGKLGLPAHLIEDARELINSNDLAFEDVIADLEKSRVTIEKERLEIESYKAEISKLKAELEKQQKHLKERSEDIINKAKDEAFNIIADAKETADEAIRKFNKASEKGMTIAQMEEERRRLGEKAKKATKKQTLTTSAPNRQHNIKDFHIGDIVYVHSLNLEGTVHSLPNSKGELTVTMGILHSQVNIKDLEIVEEAKEKDKLQKKTTSIGKLKMSKSASISAEINLIGMNKDEALMELDKYLDDAFLSHLSPVRIVHGKGAGILRDAVHSYLKKQKHVKSYRLGSFGEGDYGVTIVEFKD